MARDSMLPSEGTPFIGRRRELATLSDLFARGERLVTIAGTGGIGKTRLALAHAHRRAQRGERVRFCDLTEQRDREGLISAVARTLGARTLTADELTHSLRRLDRGLLILDNFEQLVDEASQLSEWLDSCRELRLLVTSREVIRLQQEVVLELEPLELTPEEGADRPSEALMLWSSARQRMDPTYSTARDDAGALDDIVRRLDGIPLAIELAAARANLMSVKQLRDRLGRRFEVLRERSRDRSVRRATMEGALDWSWELLEPWERDALAQCSVFAHGFNLAAAEAVLDLSAHEAAPPVLEVLSALRDKSMLQRSRDVAEGGQPGRLTMYATIRDYGARRLTATGETRAIELRHARFFAELGQRLVELSTGADGADALFDLSSDLDNLLAVAERAASREAPTTEELDHALGALRAVDKVFSTRGPLDGHREVLNAVLARSRDSGCSPVARARALRARGLMRATRGQLANGRADLERAVELTEEGSSERGRALLDLSWTYLRQRDLERVEALCEEALAIARGVGDRGLEGMVLGALGAPPKERGDDARAAKRYTEALAIHRETGNRWYEGLAHTRLAVLRLEHGDLEAAREHAGEALTVHREFGNRAAEAIMLQCLGGAAHVAGQLDEARDSYAESARIAEAIGERRLLGTALGYRAVAELELGDLEAARANLDEAVRQTAEASEHRHGALFEAYLGAVEALSGAPERARRPIEHARAILAQHADSKMEATVDVLAALVQAAQPEDARVRAEATIAEALSPRGSLSSPEESSADVRIALRIVRHALRALETASSTEDALRIDPAGAWFEPPDGARVDCRRRRALRRILVRLARQRVQQPGTPIAPEGLIAAGWPDERMSSASAQNRLYVTINRLRQLGLGDALQLVDGGYRLDPELHVALVAGE